MGDVDIRPDLCAEGGGLVDDFDGILSDMRFIMTDYEGAMANPVPVCKVVFDIDGEETTTLYSVGGQGDFIPDDTGHGLNKVRSKSTLTKTSKFILLCNSLIEAGFPLNKMDARDISPIIGTVGHFLRKAVEYRGLKKKEGDRETTVLVCTKILQLPWEAGKSKGKAKGKAKGKEVDQAVSDALAEVIQGVIIENDGEVAKKNMLSALFKIELPGEKKSTLKLATSDDFLKERDEWTYENGVLKMA